MNVYSETTAEGGYALVMENNSSKVAKIDIQMAADSWANASIANDVDYSCTSVSDHADCVFTLEPMSSVEALFDSWDGQYVTTSILLA